MIIAGLLALCAAYVGWLAVRTTAIALVSEGSSQAGALVSDEPEFTLGAAMGAFTTDRGKVRPQALPAIRHAAAEMPLDARPYLLIAADDLQAGRMEHARIALEAGRRLNPRQRWIHLLLLERYLRTGRYASAAEEFAILARLEGAAQGPIATVLATMITAPETRDAVGRTLRRDPALERLVLTSMASSDVEPSLIFKIASKSAFAGATGPGDWGTVLVDRLVVKGRYRLARLVWQRINRLTDMQVKPLLYDAALQGLPGRPPFNWAMASGNLAAVDMRQGKLEIEYYGRDSGELVGQLLLLPPGNYRFSHIVSGGQRDAASKLQWLLTCESQPDKPLVNIDLPLSQAAPRRVGFSFAVPNGCPAQRLRLMGAAGEFPVQVAATVEKLQLYKVSAK